MAYNLELDQTEINLIHRAISICLDRDDIREDFEESEIVFLDSLEKYTREFT